MVNILCIGGSHEPWHQFEGYKTSLVRILDDLPIEVHYTEDLDSLITQHIKDFDHIICCVSKKELNQDQEEGLLTSISGFNPKVFGKPKHFLGIHCATTAFQNSINYIHMVGARFLAHPPMGEPFPVQILEPNHPICRNLGDFELVDELYLMEYYGYRKDLFGSRFGEFDIPLGWIKPYGMGKVGYCALGHGEQQLKDPNLSKLTHQFVQWLIYEPTE